MFNKKWFRAIGISIPIITGVLLLGIWNAIFGVEAKTNLFNTGITPGIILGIAQIFIAWAVYKNHI